MIDERNHGAAFGENVLKCLCLHLRQSLWGFSGGSHGKESTCKAGDRGLIPGLGRSPGEGNGSPLQSSCLENHMDSRGWWAAVRGVAKSHTQLSHFRLSVSQVILHNALCVSLNVPCLCWLSLVICVYLVSTLRIKSFSYFLYFPQLTCNEWILQLLSLCHKVRSKPFMYSL